MPYSLVGRDAGCGELDLFFVDARLGVDFFAAARRRRLELSGRRPRGRVHEAWQAVIQISGAE